MSAFLHVITNGNGSGDRCVVYETQSGETLLDDEVIGGQKLFELLEVAAHGGYDAVKFHELDDEQMDNWEDNI